MREKSLDYKNGAEKLGGATTESGESGNTGKSVINVQQPAAGETRPVSILYADIVGSTGLIRHMDAESASEVLDQAIEDIRQAVNALGGHVVRIQGDGVMALFGATVILEDHAWRAILAGDDIRNGARARHADNPLALQVRVGIHSGPIFLRWQKHDFGVMLDAVGSTAHIAARVERACPANSVAITDRTLSMVNEPFETHFISNVLQNEASERIEIHELGNIQLSHGQRNAIGRRRRSRLIGRSSEWRQLKAFLKAASNGEIGSLAIVGPAGIGKSRLLEESSLLADQMLVRHVVVRGRQLQSDQPFGALRSLFARLMEFQDLKDLQSVRDYLASISFSQDVSSYLIDTLGGDQYRPAAERRVPPDRLHKIIIDGLLDLLRHSAGYGSMILLCDDLQYLDSASRRFIAEMIRQNDNIPCGVILFGRPEVHDFLAKLGVSELKLETLELTESENLAKEILVTLLPAGASQIDAMIDEIVMRSDGLPLAIEEFSRFVGRQTNGPQTNMALPPRIETIFRARLDLLSPQERKLCDVACVMGSEIRSVQLEAMKDLVDEQYGAALQALLDQNILIDRIDGRMQFSHQLLQEAAYEALSKPVRKTLHSDVYMRLAKAKAFAVPHIDLANHARSADLPEQALKHYWRACEEAVAHAALQSVVAIYKEARKLCRMLGDAGQLMASRFAMLAFDAAQQLADQEECRNDLEAIVKGKIEVDDDTVMVANAHLALINWIGGRSLEGLQNAQNAWRAITPETTLAARWYVEFSLGVLEFSNSSPVEGFRRLEAVATELSDNMLEKKFGSVISIPGFLARAFGGWMAGDIGDFEVAERLCSEASEIADRLNHNNSRLIGRIAEGYYWLLRKDADRAVEILSEADEICRDYGFAGYEPSTSARLGLALLEQGKTLQAYQVIKRSLDHGPHDRIINSSSHFLYDAEARILDAMGETAQALVKIDTAESRCEKLGDGVQAAFAKFFSLQLNVKLNGWQDGISREFSVVRSRGEQMGLKRLVYEVDEFLAARSS